MDYKEKILKLNNLDNQIKNLEKEKKEIRNSFEKELGSILDDIMSENIYFGFDDYRISIYSEQIGIDIQTEKLPTKLITELQGIFGDGEIICIESEEDYEEYEILFKR